MNSKINMIFKGSLVALMSTVCFTSCNKFLDREPITDVTPESYFSSVDQLAAYDMRGYSDNLKSTRGQQLYHTASWNAGVTLNDNNTDNLIVGDASLGYFAGQWEVPAGQQLGAFAGDIRYWNYFINRVEGLMKENKISGDASLANQYLGEAYFFRATVYFRALATFGDYPIVKEVLADKADSLKQASQRMPRNEVARFVLADLDKASSLLKDKGFKNNQRINKQVALLYKSRVALYEGTFEKYHRGSGRVPGDSNWPGKDMAYNKGKTFDINKEIDFFLGEAMKAAKQVADAVPLVPNSHVFEPAGLNKLSGWNTYFDMFNQVDLSQFSEVLLWKQYDRGLNITHDAAYILSVGGNNLGLTRSMVNAFVMANGLPIYAGNSGYKGDVDPTQEPLGRDERMRLFVFSPNTMIKNDQRDPNVTDAPLTMGLPKLLPEALENKDITGYRPRKFTSYDYDQQISNQNACYTGSPVFRASEAYLNYIEACYEKNSSLDADATKYWQAIRQRAGVNPDFNVTIANTDLNKEANVVAGTICGDLAVYSGNKMVDATLFNIRRERRCEFISEGMRWDDLIRWRSWDPLLNGRYQIEGFNLWTDLYKKYEKDGKSPFITSGDKPNMSAKTVSMYVRPLQIVKTNNPLYDGMTWRKAFYLSPIGVEDLTINKVNPDDAASSTVYQNPYWPTSVGKAVE